jgi:threonine dehydratase
MFPLAQEYVEKVVLVEDESILASQKALWNDLRLTAEAGGAAAYAALLSGSYRPEKSERVGVLVCGGNTTAVDFSPR